LLISEHARLYIVQQETIWLSEEEVEVRTRLPPESAQNGESGRIVQPREIRVWRMGFDPDGGQRKSIGRYKSWDALRSYVVQEAGGDKAQVRKPDVRLAGNWRAERGGMGDHIDDIRFRRTAVRESLPRRLSSTLTKELSDSGVTINSSSPRMILWTDID
jgi:hypothetical protein